MSNLTLNPHHLLGKTEEQAKGICENCGYTMRVVARDGKNYVVTMDLRGNRINVGLTDGKVTTITGIG